MSEQVSRRDRIAVYERDEYKCVAAGSEDQVSTCSPSLTIQHRADRGMGGTSIVVPLAGLATMCWKHNHAASHDPAFMVLATKLGWKLSKYEDPHKVAIFYRWKREWVRYDEDGTPAVVEHRDEECEASQGWDADWRSDVKVGFTQQAATEEDWR
jgi:hypothetical protein